MPEVVAKVEKHSVVKLPEMKSRVEIHTFFDKNGYLPCTRVLNDEETRELKDNFDRVTSELGEEAATYSLHNKHVTDPWVLRLATRPRVLEPLKAILGPNLILLDSRFICKFPVREETGKEAFVAWHQDVRYWGVEGDVVSVWLAVDDANAENGCMQVIPGTHKSGILEHITETKDGNLLSSNQAIRDGLYDVSKAIHCPLKAGEMSLHHGHLVHGSDTNRSTRRRCGYVIRFIATTACPIVDANRPRSFPATVLVSGQNNENHFVDHAPTWYSWRE